jgi:hypothetical protein
LEWKLVPWDGADGYPDVWRAKVGRGTLTLLTWGTSHGIPYVSSFGANSDKSFGGYLPGMDMQQAMDAVYADASKHW